MTSYEKITGIAMNILSDGLKQSIIDWQEGTWFGRPAVRITVENEFTENEKNDMLKLKNIVEVSKCYYPYAPEIKHGVIVLTI